MLREGKGFEISALTPKGDLKMDIGHLAEACILDPVDRKDRRYLCKMSVKESTSSTTFGKPFLKAATLVLDKETHRIGIQQAPASPSHALGLFYSKTESELEYLVYVLFAIDLFLLSIISGYLWNKRYDIMQVGLTNFFV